MISLELSRPENLRTGIRSKNIIKDGVRSLITGKSRMFRSEKQCSSLKMKCPNCGCWNRVSVNKVFVERRTSEIKVTILTPMYRPLSLSVCRKCGKVLARPTELMAIRRHTK